MRGVGWAKTLSSRIRGGKLLKRLHNEWLPQSIYTSFIPDFISYHLLTKLAPSKRHLWLCGFSVATGFVCVDSRGFRILYCISYIILGGRCSLRSRRLLNRAHQPESKCTWSVSIHAISTLCVTPQAVCVCCWCSNNKRYAVQVATATTTAAPPLSTHWHEPTIHERNANTKI